MRTSTEELRSIMAPDELPLPDYPEFETQDSMFDDAPSYPEETMVPTEEAEIAPAAHDSEQPSSGPLTVDDFAALEERILRAVALVRNERDARLAAEARAVAIEAQLQEAQQRNSAIDALQQEIRTLRAEREQVRNRVDRLLGQLDALEL